jgi:multiple sugar transport system permease protein
MKALNLRKYINLTLFLCLLVLVIWLFPFWWMLVTAFKSQKEILQFPPSLFPSEFFFSNLLLVFKKIPLIQFFKNSFICALSVGIAATFTSSLAGYIFAKFDFKGKGVLFLVILSTIMIPLTVIIIPLYLVTITVGLKNTLTALILPGCVNAYGIYLVRNYTLTIPDSYLEAARMDGCGEFKIYTMIILPLIKPVLIAIFIFNFMQNWDSFIWPLIVIDDITKRTLPLGLGLFTQGFGVQSWNLIMSATLVTIIPVLVIFAFLQKYFIEGITLSGLKG